MDDLELLHLERFVEHRGAPADRLERWLYHGLHSLDFPFLYYQRPLWDVVLIALSIGGIVSTVTIALPAWRRIRRNVRASRSRALDA